MARLVLMALLSALAFQEQQKPTAIVNVTVVPMDRERVVTDQTVIVQDGRINAIGGSQAIRIPNGAVRIDGRGKFLMPGLADMHVHFVREALKQEARRYGSDTSVRQPGIPASASGDHERENRAYALMFVANGVTTVRNLWGSETIDAFAHEIDAGGVVGPHVYSSGPITDGGPPIWQSSRVVETAAQAEDAVRSDKQKGYVAIKVYSALSSEAYHTIVGAAKRQGLPVVGHVPTSVGLMGAVEARQDSIEHLDSFTAVLQPDGAAGAAKPLSERIQDADLRKLPAVVRAIRESGAWICPTVVVNDLPRTDSTWLEKASFVPPDVFERYERMYPNRGIDPRATPRAHALNIAIVAALRSGGAHLLLGTDTVKRGTIPGFSLHDELDNFVKAGLTPYEAIRAGTADAAIFLREEKEFGTVSVGRRADLLLLDRNPLDDVRNTEAPTGVMIGGRWHTAEELKEQLRILRATYKH